MEQLTATAAWAFVDLKNRNIHVLPLGFLDMLVTEISVEDGIILIGRGQYVMYAKGTISEPDMLCRRRVALAPTTGDFSFFCHLGVCEKM